MFIIKSRQIVFKEKWDNSSGKGELGEIFHEEKEGSMEQVCFKRIYEVGEKGIRLVLQGTGTSSKHKGQHNRRYKIKII